MCMWVWGQKKKQLGHCAVNASVEGHSTNHNNLLARLETPASWGAVLWKQLKGLETAEAIVRTGVDI